MRIRAGAAGAIAERYRPAPARTSGKGWAQLPRAKDVPPIGIVGPQSNATLGPPRWRGNPAILAGVLEWKTGLKRGFLAIGPAWRPVEKIDITNFVVSTSRHFSRFPVAATPQV